MSLQVYIKLLILPQISLIFAENKYQRLSAKSAGDFLLETSFIDKADLAQNRSLFIWISLCKTLHIAKNE